MGLTPGMEARPASKCAFVLVDGIGDVSIPFIGNQTPLQRAAVPFCDAVAGERQVAHNMVAQVRSIQSEPNTMHAGAGLNGLLDPVEPGLACGSDTAHLSLLGYDPRRWTSLCKCS